MRSRSPRVVVGILFVAPIWLVGCSSEADTQADSPPVEPNRVTIVGTDYAFGGPRTLPPGPTEIVFDNQGEMDHEMILVRLNEGVTLDDVMEAMQGGSDPRELMAGGPGILIAQPGETTESRLLIDLQPGQTYALVCNFQDEPDAPPHTALGMLGTIEVTDS